MFFILSYYSLGLVGQGFRVAWLGDLGVGGEGASGWVARECLMWWVFRVRWLGFWLWRFRIAGNWLGHCGLAWLGFVASWSMARSFGWGVLDPAFC